MYSSSVADLIFRTLSTSPEASTSDALGTARPNSSTRPGIGPPRAISIPTLLFPRPRASSIAVTFDAIKSPSFQAKLTTSSTHPDKTAAGISHDAVTTPGSPSAGITRAVRLEIENV